MYRIEAWEIVPFDRRDNETMEKASYLIDRFYGQNPPSFDRDTAVAVLEDALDGDIYAQDLVRLVLAAEAIE